VEFTGIALITRNVAALRTFYARVLGVEAVGDDYHSELKTRGASIALFSVEGMEAMAPGSMQNAGHGSTTLGFRVEDIDAEYNRIRELGVDFVMFPTTHPWGLRSFWFRDPDGNIVNFFAPAR
jgi:predicted enzyme related to lactoylglutathione lyase